MYTAIESTGARGEGNKKYPTAARPHYSYGIKNPRGRNRVDKFELKLYCYKKGRFWQTFWIMLHWLRAKFLRVGWFSMIFHIFYQKLTWNRQRIKLDQVKSLHTNFDSTLRQRVPITLMLCMRILQNSTRTEALFEILAENIYQKVLSKGWESALLWKFWRTS